MGLLDFLLKPVAQQGSNVISNFYKTYTPTTTTGTPYLSSSGDGSAPKVVRTADGGTKAVPVESKVQASPAAGSVQPFGSSPATMPDRFDPINLGFITIDPDDIINPFLAVSMAAEKESEIRTQEKQLATDKAYLEATYAGNVQGGVWIGDREGYEVFSREVQVYNNNVETYNKNVEGFEKIQEKGIDFQISKFAQDLLGGPVAAAQEFQDKVVGANLPVLGQSVGSTAEAIILATRNLFMPGAPGTVLHTTSQQAARAILGAVGIQPPEDPVSKEIDEIQTNLVRAGVEHPISSLFTGAVMGVAGTVGMIAKTPYYVSHPVETVVGIPDAAREIYAMTKADPVMGLTALYVGGKTLEGVGGIGQRTFMGVGKYTGVWRTKTYAYKNPPFHPLGSQSAMLENILIEDVISGARGTIQTPKGFATRIIGREMQWTRSYREAGGTFGFEGQYMTISPKYGRNVVLEPVGQYFIEKGTVNIPGLRALDRTLRSRVHIVEDVPTIASEFSKAERQFIFDTWMRTGQIPEFWYKEMILRAAGKSERIGQPVATVTPKLHIGSMKPELETMLIFGSEQAKHISSSKFAGLTDVGVIVRKVRFGTQDPVPPGSALRENFRYNLAQRENYVKAMSVDINRNIGELFGREMTKPGQFGAHGLKHLNAVYREMSGLRSESPIIRSSVSAIESRVASQLHDAARIWGGETEPLPHAEAVAEAIRRGFVRYEPLTRLPYESQLRVAEMVGQHTRIRPGLTPAGLRTKILYRPSIEAKAFASADRLARAGEAGYLRKGMVFPKPESTFMHQMGKLLSADVTKSRGLFSLDDAAQLFPASHIRIDRSYFPRKGPYPPDASEVFTSRLAAIRYRTESDLAALNRISAQYRGRQPFVSTIPEVAPHYISLDLAGMDYLTGKLAGLGYRGNIPHQVPAGLRLSEYSDNRYFRSGIGEYEYYRSPGYAVMSYSYSSPSYRYQSSMHAYPGYKADYASIPYPATPRYRPPGAEYAGTGGYPGYGSQYPGYGLYPTYPGYIPYPQRPVQPYLPPARIRFIPDVIKFGRERQWFPDMGVFNYQWFNRNPVPSIESVFGGGGVTDFERKVSRMSRSIKLPTVNLNIKTPKLPKVKI